MWVNEAMYTLKTRKLEARISSLRSSCGSVCDPARHGESRQDGNSTMFYPSNPGFHPKTRSFPNKWGIPTVPWEEKTGNEEKAFCLGLWADAAHDEPMPDTMVIDRNIKKRNFPNVSIKTPCKNAFLLRCFFFLLRY